MNKCNSLHQQSKTFSTKSLRFSKGGSRGTRFTCDPSLFIDSKEKLEEMLTHLRLCVGTHRIRYCEVVSLICVTNQWGSLVQRTNFLLYTPIQIPPSVFHLSLTLLSFSVNGKFFFHKSKWQGDIHGENHKVPDAQVCVGCG